MWSHIIRYYLISYYQKIAEMYELKSMVRLWFFQVKRPRVWKNEKDRENDILIRKDASLSVASLYLFLSYSLNGCIILNTQTE